MFRVQGLGLISVVSKDPVVVPIYGYRVPSVLRNMERLLLLSYALKILELTHMYYSLKSLNGGYIGDYIGDYKRGY